MILVARRPAVIRERVEAVTVKMSVILIHTDRFAEHLTPPGHPERPERAEVMDVVAAKYRDHGVDVVAPRPATGEQLARVHDSDYLRRIAETAGRAVALDPDTYTSADSQEIALLAAGAAVNAVDHVIGGSHRSALAMVRPPGHHAERNRAMGFCLYNNVAIAAAHARATGTAKVAIVDYDVHHGNGTQHIFEADPHVLYVSTHQYPFYPGTGTADEIGRERGAGYTVNLPIEAGAVDEDYQTVFAQVVTPVLRQFEPDLLIVSAGFDAHERDPLGGMRLTTPSFAAMTMELRVVAEECCRGRMVAVTEGGYDLLALRESLEAVVETLRGSMSPTKWPASGTVSHRGRASADLARHALARYWKI
jgi:acetoin utilization deacetylase AcuC-like enzyme